MRMRARVDRNQLEITKALRKVGVSVQPLSMVGRGVADLLCGFQGQNYLLEVKDGDKCQSRQKLSQDERRWHDLWRGQVCIVSSVKEAYEAVGIRIENWI